MLESIKTPEDAYSAKHILKYDILSKREYPDCS